MTTDLKLFCGAYFPKDKALKKTPDLKPLAGAINSTTKAVAEAVFLGKLAADYPEHIDDYFKVKIWEHREDLPCPELDMLSPDFFGSSVVWNVNAGEPAASPQPETEMQEELKTVACLDQTSRAACLALFGPVAEITAAQYGQIVDLKNDDESSFARELAEALTKEARALALSTERQEQLLAWLRESVKESAQWPDIKRQITKWIDTPVDKRPQAARALSEENRTDSGAALGGGNQTDRSPDLVHNLSTLRIEVAVAILSMHDEIDIYSIPNRYLSPAKAMAEAGQDTRFTAWWKPLRVTPGILDYSRAAIIALIKSAPEDIWLNPIQLREYINHTLIESDHANPGKKTIDIACSPKPRTDSEKTENDETQSPLTGETEIPAVCPARALQLDKELNEAFEQHTSAEQHADEQPRIENLGGGVFSVDTLINNSPSNEGEKTENRPVMSEREMEIAVALNDLISGRTRIMGKEEAEGVVACTGHLVSDVIPLLVADIATTEFCLSPDFTDEEIHDVATTLLDGWSEDISVRQKIALDAIVEYRCPEPPKAIVIDPPVITAKPKKAAEPDSETHIAIMLNYRQQLILAAMQGMCANPSYRSDFEDLPAMAIELADSVINQDGI